MHHKYKCLSFLVTFFAPFVQALPLEMANQANKVCEIIKSNDNAILVKTAGQYRWKTVVDCVKETEATNNDYIPYSASHNPGLTIRQSLINPVNSFVTEKYAQNPLLFVTNYTRTDRETDQKSDCYQLDSNDDCQLTQSTTVPEMYVWLKKLPLNSVVHTKVLYSATHRLPTAPIQKYQELIDGNSSYDYGIYLHIVPQSSESIVFITASKPGVSKGVEHRLFEDMSVIDKHLYEDSDFDHFDLVYQPDFLGDSKEQQDWYERAHEEAAKLPESGMKYTISLDKHFFYEAFAIDSRIQYLRLPVRDQQLSHGLKNLLKQTVKDGQLDCMRNILYGLRVTPLKQGSEQNHIVELIIKKLFTTEEGACLNEGIKALVGE